MVLHRLSAACCGMRFELERRQEQRGKIWVGGRMVVIKENLVSCLSKASWVGQSQNL